MSTLHFRKSGKCGKVENGHEYSELFHCVSIAYEHFNPYKTNKPEKITETRIVFTKNQSHTTRIAERYFERKVLRQKT